MTREQFIGLLSLYGYKLWRKNTNIYARKNTNIYVDENYADIIPNIYKSATAYGMPFYTANRFIIKYKL